MAQMNINCFQLVKKLLRHISMPILVRNVDIRVQAVCQQPATKGAMSFAA